MVLRFSSVAYLLAFYVTLHALDCPVDVSFNRFNQSTSYSTPIELTAGQRMSVVFHSVVGEEDVNSRLVFARAGNSFRYDACPIVRVLADGKRLTLAFDYRVSVTEDVIFETFSANLTLSQFSTLANAEKVEYQICNDEFQIPSIVLCTGRDIYQRIK